MAEDLNEFICNKKVLEVFSSEILFVIIKKMVLHEDNKIKANNLEKVFTVLMTIQPNSVESDRAFSGLGCFVTKVRTDFEVKPQKLLCFYAVIINSRNFK